MRLPIEHNFSTWRSFNRSAIIEATEVAKKFILDKQQEDVANQHSAARREQLKDASTKLWKELDPRRIEAGLTATTGVFGAIKWFFGLPWSMVTASLALRGIAVALAISAVFATNPFVGVSATVGASVAGAGAYRQLEIIRSEREVVEQCKDAADYYFLIYDTLIREYEVTPLSEPEEGNAILGRLKCQWERFVGELVQIYLVRATRDVGSEPLRLFMTTELAQIISNREGRR